MSIVTAKTVVKAVPASAVVVKANSDRVSATAVKKRTGRNSGETVELQSKKRSIREVALANSENEMRMPKEFIEKEREALRRKRLELNRLAAIKSRRKKKKYVTELKNKMVLLTADKKKMQTEINTLKAIHEQLRTAYTTAFENNVSMRRNLATMQKGFEALLEKANQKTYTISAVAAARPVLEQLQQRERQRRTTSRSLPFPAALPTAESASILAQAQEVKNITTSEIKAANNKHQVDRGPKAIVAVAALAGLNALRKTSSK